MVENGSRAFERGAILLKPACVVKGRASWTPGRRSAGSLTRGGGRCSVLAFRNNCQCDSTLVQTTMNSLPYTRYDRLMIHQLNRPSV